MNLDPVYLTDQLFYLMQFCSMREMGNYVHPTFEFRICSMSILQNQVSCLKMFLNVFRYNNTTGTFTVPPDADGYYYFSVYLIVQDGNLGYFNIEINGNILCTAYTDQTDLCIW